MRVIAAVGWIASMVGFVMNLVQSDEVMALLYLNASIGWLIYGELA